MDVKFDLSKTFGKVNAPSSKSWVIRALLCSALSKTSCEIKLNGFSDDVNAMIEALKTLGVDISANQGIVNAEVNTAFNSGVLVDCKASAAVLRFLLPVCSALGLEVSFDSANSLKNRPISQLLSLLCKNGVTASSSTLPLTVSGQLKSGHFELLSTVSSQYISGLLFALPLLDGDSIITYTPPLNSKPYTDLTIDMLRKFNIDIIKEEGTFLIKGNQRYISPGKLQAEGDWSSAAFYAVLGALKGDIQVNSLSMDSKQGDKKILPLLEEMGARVLYLNDGFKVEKSELRGIKIDAREIPDLIPVLSAAAFFAHGEASIINASALKYKESNRLNCIKSILETAGASVILNDDDLIIKGDNKKITPFITDSFFDHRMIQLAALLSYKGDCVTVKNAEHIKKSYFGFFNDIVSMGGRCDVINNGQ